MIISRLENGIILKESIPSIDFDINCDVLTVGAGCAGIYAADAAAKEGADTVLLENSDGIGGMHVLGCVAGYYYGGEGGSYLEDDLKEKDIHFDSVTYKLEYKALKQYERLSESGVRILLSHSPTALVFDGTRVVGIEAFDGKKTVYISAKTVIDATSDGYLLSMCEISKSYGKELDGKRAPFSVISRYTRDGKCIGVNKDAGYIDQYDVYDFSKKTMMAHREAVALFSLGEYLHMATHTGVREGLSFEGEQKLNYEDILFGKQEGKTLFYAYSDFDRHGSDKALYEDVMQNWWVISNLATVTAKIPVPMGAVVPKGISGLVTAGRCISSDSHVRGAVRMNRDMFRMGECVGTAAAISVKNNCGFLDINYPEYLTRVTQKGCFDGYKDRKFGFDFPAVRDKYTPIEFDIEKNYDLLKTETPGVAIWSAYIAKDRESVRKRLANDLSSAEDRLYRYNLAIALGITGDKRALPTLRDILQNRDEFYFKDCRRSNQFRSAIAACLIGRLGTDTDIPLLWQIAFDENEVKRQMYHTLKPDYLYYSYDDKNFLYYEMFTHSVAALLKIHKRLDISTKTLRAELEKLRDDGTAVDRIIYIRDGSAHAELCDFIDYIIKEAQ